MRNQNRNNTNTNKDLQTTDRGYPMTIFDLFSRPLAEFDMFDRPLAYVDDVKVDIQDKGDHYELKADLPGTKKEDIKLDYDRGVFSISATHHTQTEKKDEDGYLIRERHEGSYARSFAIDNIDEDGVEASFKNGELLVTLKKKNGGNKKTIAIK